LAQEDKLSAAIRWPLGLNGNFKTLGLIRNEEQIDRLEISNRFN